MSIEDIRALKHAKPFRPFELVTKYGERIYISNPIRIALSLMGKSVTGSGQDGWFFLPISEIAVVGTLKKRKQKPSSKRDLLPSSRLRIVQG